MVVDWLATGLNPNTSTIFVQSKVPEHAELHLLLSMTTPLSWLERVPSYKDQQEKLKTKDLSTYGFLGYPLLQSADILIYKAGLVPVGEDQVAHVEFTREVARRFNFIYGREADFEEKAEAAVTKMGKKQSKLYRALRKSYQETGDDESLVKAKALLGEQQNITLGDRERLLGYAEGLGKIILTEPEALLTKASKMPGLDGQKMSKSYNNMISLREEPEAVKQKINRMPTDPAQRQAEQTRVIQKNARYGSYIRYIHQKKTLTSWVNEGCTNAKIGCLDCKKPLIEAILIEQQPIRERADEYMNDPETVRGIIAEGCEAARDVARETLEEVRDSMGLIYR